MTAVDNRGVVLNLNNNEAERLIKIFIHHPQLNDFTPRERRSYEVGDSSELLNRIEKLEDGLINTCKITRSFIKHSEKNFKQIPKMIETERRNRESCFSLLNERMSNSHSLFMDKFVELGDIIKTMSQNNMKFVEKPQTNNGGVCEVKCSVVENRGTSISITNMEDNFNTEEPVIANLSLGSGSTRRVSDNSFTWSNDNAVEGECDDKLNNSASDSVNDDEDTFQ
uniref:BLOC-1-related complex subunit 5 n=1 Tax=Strongyloides papillosus TaxID=174720 RepID=A0A0N5BAG8_STREA